MAFDDAGNGPAVVLLHGYPFNRTMWREQTESLQSRYRVIAPDLRGHGETGVAPAPATMEQMAQDVAGLMDALSISSAVVGGLSMGGYVALAFYRLFRARVSSLVLADTRASADTEEARQSRVQQSEKVLREGMEGITDALLPKLLAPETISGRPGVVQRIREMMLRTNPKGASAALQGMAQRQDHTSFLPEISARTLILVGRHDAITPLEEAEKMHQGIAGSQVEVIEGAGHVSNIEQPIAFNRALLAFLGATDKRTRPAADQSSS